MKVLAKLSLLLALTVLTGSIIFADTSYFRELVNKGNASCFDAFRVASLLKTGNDDPATTFDSLKDSLFKDRIIPGDWSKKKADNFINRGEMAYMLFNILKLKGGLSVKIFGVSCRYAFRECVDKKLMASGYPNQVISGEELISILDAAGKYQDQIAGKKPAAKPAENKVEKETKPEAQPAPAKEEPKETKPETEPKVPVGGPR